MTHEIGDKTDRELSALEETVFYAVHRRNLLHLSLTADPIFVPSPWQAALYPLLPSPFTQIASRPSPSQFPVREKRNGEKDAWAREGGRENLSKL